MDLLKFIGDNEGLKLHMYKCTADKWTIGYGYNLEEGIDQETADFLLKKKVDDAVFDIMPIFSGFADYPVEKQIALVDMMYNLGKPRFLQFKKMIAAVKAGDWQEAGKQAIDSKWYRQVGSRGKKVVALLTGLDVGQY